MGQIIKGKPVADAITEQLAEDVNKLKDMEITPKLTIMRVGENPSDLSYERGALKRYAKVGIDTEVKAYPKDISQEQFIEEIKKVNEDKKTHGILIFRPLPKQMDEDVIKHVISPEKDMDCFSPINVAKLMSGDKTGFPPCTPTAVIEMLKHYNVEMKGKNAVVIGRSMVVGKPVSMLLLDENATVTICHSRTKNMAEIASKADILVVGIGKAKMITKDYVGKDAVVVDVGINVDEEGKLCGDVNTEDCLERASLITPVPAGVGSVTTSILGKHVIKACKAQNNL